MSDPLLVVEDLSVRYGGICALDGLSLSVRRGEIVSLVGANGAGKTTTLRAISGIVVPVRGRVTFAGRRITGLPAHAVARLGIAHVPEGRGVFPEMTVLDNLRMGAYARAREADFEDGLSRVFRLFPRLKERLRQRAGTLSGGEQQMLAMGRAIVAKPELMLLDEPSMGLSPLLVSEIFRLIAEINREGTTILLVEQNARMALAVAHRACVLESGRIALEGTAEAMREDPRVRAAYLGGAEG